MNSTVDPASAAPGAWRLLFAVDAAGNIHVRSRQRVEMTVPPTEPLAEAAPTAGFWAELRDVRERTRYRLLIPDPVEAGIEVPPEPGGEGFTHVPDSGPRVFSVLVPDLDGADHVTLVRSGRTRRAGSTRREEVARLPLKEESR